VYEITLEDDEAKEEIVQSIRETWNLVVLQPTNSYKSNKKTPYRKKIYCYQEFDVQNQPVSIINDVNHFIKFIEKKSGIKMIDFHAKDEVLPTLEAAGQIDNKSNRVVRYLKKFIDHWIFPVFISTLGYAITTGLVIYRLKPSANSEDYVLSIIVPSVVSFLSYIGTRKAVESSIKREHD
jgi:hypothetical protein